jgi:hypothetical protein
MRLLIGNHERRSDGAAHRKFMREDMYKVIVERPRHGRYMKSEHPCPQDLEESPNHEGLRKRHRYRKSLNENLNPLKRFLAKQVNRPWDKVFSELCANIDRRNTVQQHIHQHIDDYVARKVIEFNGELYSARSWGGPQPLSNYWRAELYVDPVTGILRKNIFRERSLAERKRSLLLANDTSSQYRRILDTNHQLHRLDGTWFLITLATVPEKPAKKGPDKPRYRLPIPMDVIRKKAAWDCPCWRDEENIRSNQSLFGNCELYAAAKRQLNSHELKRYKLHNNQEGKYYE